MSIVGKFQLILAVFCTFSGMVLAILGIRRVMVGGDLALTFISSFLIILGLFNAYLSMGQLYK